MGYLLTGWTKDPNYPVVAMANAQTSDMIFTQPVVYEFKDIKKPYTTYNWYTGPYRYRQKYREK